MTEPVTILLAEDDESLGYILKEYLELHTYDVQLAPDGEEALRLFQSTGFDLCILDVMMPKKDGFTLATEIKKINKRIPIIFLTAKSLKVDKLKGFKLGADDYLVKPIDEEELIARIEAIIRRYKTTSPIETQSTFTIGNYTFDHKNQTLTIDGQKQTLTIKETEVLKVLCENKGTIVERDLILHQLWGESDYFNRRSMDVFISRLRKYLSQDDRITIRNVHGKGFVLEVGG